MNNFTNLKNSYMFGKANRKNNYFQNYKNFENDIDDPIFTGFTLSIDTTSSPLFLGGYELGDGLAGKIEETLKNAYNNTSYNIYSHVSRDKFPNGNNIGYGHLTTTYGEELSYGAADYIYG